MNNALAIGIAFLSAGSTISLPKDAVKSAASAPKVVVQPASALPNKYFYDLKTGQCLHAKTNKPGLNKALSPEVLADFRDAECMDLRGVSLNGDNLAYPRLKDWNLRGADLREARLFFAHLDNADLRGANMEGFLYGYASIHGKVDEFTKGLQGCRTDATHVSCIR